MWLSPLLERTSAALLPKPEPLYVENDAVRARRRMLVCAVLVAGSLLLGFALARGKDSAGFYALTLSLSAVWGGGAVLSGPLHWGSRAGKRALDGPIILGIGAWIAFVIGDEASRLIPALHRQVLDILDFADKGALWLILFVAILNAVAEEAFFRGALYSAFGRQHPAVWSTVIYVVVTSAGANVSLVLAAAVMGTVFALERRATRGVLAPMITHVVWSILVVLALPR